jgi:hypothetical protein
MIAAQTVAPATKVAPCLTPVTVNSLSTLSTRTARTELLYLSSRIRNAQSQVHPD